MLADRLLDKVDVVFAQRSQVSHRLRDRPTSVRIDTQSGFRTKVRAHGRDHLGVLRVVEPDLQVEHLEAGFEARFHLGAEALNRPTCEVVEVRCLTLLESTQKSPQRLSARSAADVPQSHVDPCPGEVARAGAELPEAVREDVATHGVAIPGVSPDDEGRHRPERGVD
jgi:hypothetical protein